VINHWIGCIEIRIIKVNYAWIIFDARWPLLHWRSKLRIISPSRVIPLLACVLFLCNSLRLKNYICHISVFCGIGLKNSCVADFAVQLRCSKSLFPRYFDFLLTEYVLKNFIFMKVKFVYVVWMKIVIENFLLKARHIVSNPKMWGYSNLGQIICGKIYRWNFRQHTAQFVLISKSEVWFRRRISSVKSVLWRDPSNWAFWLFWSSIIAWPLKFYLRPSYIFLVARVF